MQGAGVSDKCYVGVGHSEEGRGRRAKGNCRDLIGKRKEDASMYLVLYLYEKIHK